MEYGNNLIIALNDAWRMEMTDTNNNVEELI